MKIKGLISLFCACLVMTSCKVGTVAYSGGKEDLAYLEFVSQKKMPAVDVDVDGTTFSAVVTKQKRTRIKGTVYAIAPGKRHVTVSKGGEVVYDRTIMLSTQETKIIEIP